MHGGRPPSQDTPPASAHCTLVIPTFNAADFIAGTVTRLRQFVRVNPGWRVLFVCDGCTDDTAARLAGLIEGDRPYLDADAYPVNRGKGYALRRGLSMARTPYRFFTDADLAYGPDEALKLLKVLEAGADLAVANRADPRSQFVMSPGDFPSIYRRHLMSRAFNAWLRWVLPIRILDTQAGLKGLTAAAWEDVADSMESEGFFFDVELLARAQATGLKLGETPVVVRYQDPTTVRMVVHGWSMILDSLCLRRDLRRGRRVLADRRKPREYSEPAGASVG